MCRRVNCKQCGKPSWAGCGAHVEMVLGDVPRSERCQCHERGAAPIRAAKTSKSASAPSAEPSGPVGRFAKWLKQ